MNTDLYTTLQNGGIAVLRTDTLYGIVARAADEQAVARIFEVKQRDLAKALIVLIARAEDAFDGAELMKKFDDVVRPTSIIVDSPHAPEWLRHSDGTVAYRVPKSAKLRELLKQTGPLVAPSANPQGEQPASTVAMAREYFGDKIDCYEDGGVVSEDSAPSRIVRVLPNGELQVIRP